MSFPDSGVTLCRRDMRVLRCISHELQEVVALGRGAGHLVQCTNLLHQRERPLPTSVTFGHRSEHAEPLFCSVNSADPSTPMRRPPFI